MRTCLGVSACMMFANVLLAKVSYKASPESVWEGPPKVLDFRREIIQGYVDNLHSSLRSDPLTNCLLGF